jgi:threonine/homoserine/homoserine lactone efflux protein
VPWVAVMGFLVAIVPIALTPGVSFTLVTQRTLAGQRQAAGWVIAGTATGTYIHALLATAGLSALVMRSAEAFTVVKIVGGVYLIALGAWTMWQTRRRRPDEREVPPRLPWTGHHSYPQALLANLLNPKAASVYLTLARRTSTTGRPGPTPNSADAFASASFRRVRRSSRFRCRSSPRRRYLGAVLVYRADEAEAATLVQILSARGR